MGTHIKNYKLKKIKEFFMFIIFILFVACTESNTKQIENYFLNKGDTLCINSFKFIIDNLSKEEADLLFKDKELIIKDIELAVGLNREKIINNDISFKLFCEYILPLRIFNEPLEEWRADCLLSYGNLINLSADSICNVLNKRLKNNFSFGWALNAYSMPWSELKLIKHGSCFHMSKSLVYPMRSLGIPTSLDIVYNWGTASGGHCWNVFYDGKMKCFMGREEATAYNPFLVYKNVYYPDKSAYRYPPKIFRKIFSINNDILELTKGVMDEDIPIILRDCRIMDVTDEYFIVSDLKFKINNLNNDVKNVYLSVFNDDWVPAAASRVENGYITFRSMNRNILYLVSLYKQNQVIPIDYPIYLSKDGSIKKLVPNEEKLLDINIAHCYPMFMEYLFALTNSHQTPRDIFEGLGKGKYLRMPNKGELYSLYYWSCKGWKIVDSKVASSSGLLFRNIPSNSLYKLIDRRGNIVGRCFIISKDSISWM